MDMRMPCPNKSRRTEVGELDDYQLKVRQNYPQTKLLSLNRITKTKLTSNKLQP